MRTPSPQTASEELEALDKRSALALERCYYEAVIAIELRALRLMLRDELREAAWPLKQWAELNYAPIVPRPESMKAPDE